MSAPPLLDRVFALLPADGRPVLFVELERLARAAGMNHRELGGPLGELCTDRKAAVESRNGYRYVRRLAAAETDFPLRARPAPPRVTRGRRPEARR